MAKPSYREGILDAGLLVMFRSGYEGSSVRDICAAAGAPFGSFINHFGSKEAFVKEVLNRYFANLQETVRSTLNDASLSPRQRLQQYLQIISGLLADDRWNRGCLIGDLSLGASAQSDLLRERLLAIFQEWLTPFAACIAQAQSDGEIDATFDPMDLAEFLLSSWEGAILRMKLERSPAALERFQKIIFKTVLKERK
jgi:TetR/AcrR family transcriptional repressor of nem operon